MLHDCTLPHSFPRFGTSPGPARPAFCRNERVPAASSPLRGRPVGAVRILVRPVSGSVREGLMSEVASNDEPLDFARPLADLADLRVAHHPLDR